VEAHAKEGNCRGVGVRDKDLASGKSETGESLRSGGGVLHLAGRTCLVTGGEHRRMKGKEQVVKDRGTNMSLHRKKVGLQILSEASATSGLRGEGRRKINWTSKITRCSM